MKWIWLLIMLLVYSAPAGAQDLIYMPAGDSLPCRIVLNPRKEKINVRSHRAAGENLFGFVVVEFSNDSVRILSPDQLAGFKLGASTANGPPGIFYSLPFRLRSNYDHFKRNISHAKSNGFYKLMYRDNDFTLLARLENAALDMDYLAFLLRHSDSVLLVLHSRKEIFRFLGLPGRIRTDKWLRGLRQWNFNALIQLLQRRQEWLLEN